jgi:hypothetical protein
MKYFQMKFLTKKVFSPGMIVLIHVAFSIALIMAWTVIKRGWDFSVTSFSNENFYRTGGPDHFSLAAVGIGVMFKYLHFNHLTFYLFNTFLSAMTVIMFFNMAHTCLDRKLSLYITAVFAFNPEFVFYNNFVLKENIIILAIVVIMYLFFKALATNSLGYKILFCLLLPLVPVLRKPLVLMVLLPIVFLPKCTKKLILISGIAATSCVIIYLLQLCWTVDIGNYGATKTILKDIYGAPTTIKLCTIFLTPSLLAEYLFRSTLYYIRPGWSAGMKFNSFLVPYTLIAVYIFIASLRYRHFLSPTYSRVYLTIFLIIIGTSLVLIIYDPIERYRYSVYQFGFTLLILNLRGYQEYINSYLHPATTEMQIIPEYVTT